MKVLIASDLHGSLKAGQLLYKRFIEEGADEMVLLGDLYYHGPRNDVPSEYDPMLLATLLNGLKDKLTVIKGNCDSEVDETISEFPFLSGRTVRFGKHLVSLDHGHHYQGADLPPNVGNIFLHGHTHKCSLRWVGDVLVGNPGSAAMPRSGTSAGYLILTDDTLSLKDLASGKFMQTEQLPPTD